MASNEFDLFYIHEKCYAKYRKRISSMGIDELLPQAKFNNIPFNPIVRILVFFPFFFDHIDYPCLGEILVTKTKSNLHCSIYQGSSMLIGQV